MRRQEVIKKELDQIRLMRAAMCSGWEREQWFVDFDKGKNLKDEQLRQFILDYFKQSYVAPFDLEGFSCEKFTPQTNTPGLQIRPKSIVLYGADYMPTKKVIKYFSYFEPLEIKWMNDSSCEVVFQSQAQAKRAIIENACHFQTKIEYQQYLEVNFDQRPMNEQLVWFEIAPYYQMAFERKLYARIATNAEKTDFNPQQAMILQYATKRIEFNDLYARKYEETRDRLWRQRKLKWGQNENFDNGKYRHPKRDRSCYDQRSRSNSFERSNNSFERRNESKMNASHIAADMSKFNYSFERYPNIKEEVDNEQPDEDLSMRSFQQRFDKLDLQDNANISVLSFKKNKQQQEESDRNLNESFLRALNVSDSKVKEEQRLNESMSFKKRPPETIVIDDD